MSLKDFEKYRDFAIKVAKEAGDNVLMKHYNEYHEQDWDARQHFKTKVDQESDELIRTRIKETYPKHNIYSEENKNLEKGSEFSWVVDPLDGTIGYTRKMNDYFSVNIAFAIGKEPVVGVTYAPKRKELYHAVKGEGAYCNDEIISPSLEENINHVMIGFDSDKETKKFKRAVLAQYIEKLLAPDGVACTFSSGCASVPLAMTADGHYDGYAALSLQPWDMAAGVVINREAGNIVTNINGKEWNLDEESILAANPKLHGKLLDFLDI